MHTYSRFRKLAVIGTFIALVLLSLVVAGAAAQQPAPTSPQDSETIATYSGQATMNVELVDVYGQSLGWHQYTTNIDIFFGTPQTAGMTMQETNPFHLLIQSTPLNNDPGEFSIYSSLVYDGVLFQYWDIQIVGSDSFVGTLSDNHISESIAINMFTIPREIAPNLTMPYPEAMMNGTTLSGSFDTAGNLTMLIEGNATHLQNPFTINLTASLESGDVPIQPAPVAPSNLTAALTAPDEITLTWSDNSGNETAFDIEESMNDGEWQSLGQVDADATEVRLTAQNGFLCGTTYAYRIRAVNAAAQSAYSNTVSVETAPCAGSERFYLPIIVSKSP